MHGTMATTIKKYANRRLYDTKDSKYITIDELADKVRYGEDVRVVDAASGEDLTQATLVQVIIEGRGAGRMLPVPLLTQMIRLDDEELGEFLGNYMAWALEMYMQAKQGAQQLAPYNPFATMPFTAANTFARMFGGGPQPTSWRAADAPRSAPRAPQSTTDDDVADLRRELEELKNAMRKRRK